jgi:acyl-CoA reductase-like NAD-dependent aldehyde dehydrogenase
VASVEAAAAARPPAVPLATVLDVPRGRTLELGDGAAERAAEVVEHAFGRARTLSGQLPSRIEAVRCEARAFSGLTEALLAELAAAPDARDPVPLIDAEALVALFEVRARGLDEGATLIDGGLVAGRDHAPSVRPLVFTNVEEEMQLLALPAPGPLLRLVRVQPPRRAAPAGFGGASGAG